MVAKDLIAKLNMLTEQQQQLPVTFMNIGAGWAERSDKDFNHDQLIEIR